MIKILRINVDGLYLFDKEFQMDFFSSQRIDDVDKENLFHLFSNVYINPSIAIIGINASGKTSILNVLILALKLINNEPLNYSDVTDILVNSKKTKFTIYYYSDQNIYKLESFISPGNNSEGSYMIEKETLWCKPCSKVRTRKALFDFDENQIIKVRNEKDKYLSEDVSITIAQNKENNDFLSVSDMRIISNKKQTLLDNVPLSVIRFLDPTIEYVETEPLEARKVIKIKFFKSNEIIVNSINDLGHYLSSGTVKGMIVFTEAIKAFSNGGYLLIDELENHFNKEIVFTLVRMFMDHRMNRSGAVLVYTTHYPELLDQYDRNDNIYITRNKNGIKVENFADILIRNDIKKSEVYQSDLLGGTAPSYETYISLRHEIEALLKDDQK